MPTIITDPSTAHFVKFYRGSPAAWRILLENPNKISDDTLYFIYESAENTREGKLYLGQKLISGSSSGEGSVGDTININDLADVFIDDETLSHKQILVYNDATNKWENTSLSTIINTAVGEMVGATASTDGIAGLVPVPRAGDQNKFLSGSGTWKKIDVPTVPTFDTKVFSLDSSTNILSLKDLDLAPVGSHLVKGADNTISWTMESPSRFSMKIVTLEKLQAMVNGTDSETPDPQAIYLVANGNDVTTSNAYDEYVVINNNIEKLGQFANFDLTNYVTIPTFEVAIRSVNSILYDTQDTLTGEEIPGLISRVSHIETNYVSKADIGDLNTLLLSPGNSTLVEEVNDINERLKWQELEEE